MKYSYEYKKHCVELYRHGKWPETPEGVSPDRFHHAVVEWNRLEKTWGLEALQHKNQNKVWTAEEKYELVAKVLAGASKMETAISAGISTGLLYQWVRCYKMKGYQGLASQRKGRPPKEPDMKKKVAPAELTPSEREEMILLRAENERLRAEIAVVKKRDCLERREMRSATQGEKAALVKELREERYRLNDLLDAIGLSRSTYYYELSKTDKVKERNADLSSEIVAIFNENRKRYGVRRVHHELLNRGFCVNHKRVQRIMNRLSLAGKRPKEKYHSYKGDVGKVADNIIKRDFSTENPLQKWTTDVSQFNLSWGKCYISPILDMNTNEIISYSLSLSPNMEQIKDMLQKAFKRFPSVQGLIMHSDQGWQYQHAFYRKELEKHGIVQSMSRKGNCYDNCIMETFFGRLKNEMFYGFEKNYPSFEAFSKAIADYIDYYNNSRIQAKTKWTPPTKFREASMAIT